MRYRTAILLVLSCLFLQVAAKTKTVEGNYTFYVPSTMTRAQAEEEAVRRAKIDALSREYGVAVVASSISIVTNDEERFYSNGFDLVKGEWLQTIGTPEIKMRLDGEDLVLSVRIKGKARRKASADIDLSVKILRNGPSDRHESREFKKGDRMYLHFVSPVDGFVSVYQHDPVNDNVYCLLPYKKDGTGSVAVEHDREYVFFSKTMSDNPGTVDEYQLGCSEDGEVNTLYILFSPHKFHKAGSTEEDKYTPRSIPFADFERWKGKAQAQDEYLQVVTKSLIIRE